MNFQKRSIKNVLHIYQFGMIFPEESFHTDLLGTIKFKCTLLKFVNFAIRSTILISESLKPKICYH